MRVLVAGGSGGIGSAVCELLAQRGCDLAFTYRGNERKADEVAAAVRSHGRKAIAGRVDLTDFSRVKEFAEDAAEELGGLDGVVYAAGPHLALRYINEIDPAEWAATVNSDINGCFNLVAATLPLLRDQESGSYVALVTGAVDTSAPRDVMSAAPKAAIQSLMKGLATEEGRSNIRANCVGPGWVDTPLSRDALASLGEAAASRWLKAVPMRRFGTTEETARAVAWLLSDESSYVTGETIAVAGGLQI